MPELRWDDLDFMTVLETKAKNFDEDYGTIIYRAQHDSLALNVIVSPFHCSLQVEVENEDATVLKTAVRVFGGIRRVIDKRGEFLEVDDCVLIRDWDLFPDNGPQDTPDKWEVVGLYIFLKPNIRIIFH